MKRGILGGTFDPVHSGHLVIAGSVKTQLGLDEVIFLPAGQPWWKDRKITAAEHRLNMLGLALKNQPYFKVSRAEIERTGPTYADETIAEMRRHFDPGDGLYFIIGWDVVAELPLWRDPARLIQLCRLAAVPRPGYPRPDLPSLEVKIPGLTNRLTMLGEPLVDISATNIRERVAEGLSIDELVPAAVAEYIRRHGLYLRKK
ncbi:MAG: nicotinate-nucleotide adenylyltransferase [Dehalococcoidales bacterium]|nr:nicotinate-nucleotide adenylyltransferase [Dehalococcoidales bacterium]